MKKIIILAALVFSFCSAFAQRPLYRYYNQKTRKHFYTINFEQYGNGAQGWTFDGAICQVYASQTRVQGLVPVYHLVNATSRDNYYTTKKFVPGRELDGFMGEGEPFFIYKFKQEGTVPLLEFYNPNTADHFYTTNRNEMGPERAGYVYDTVIGFVIPK